MEGVQGSAIEEEARFNLVILMDRLGRLGGYVDILLKPTTRQKMMKATVVLTVTLVPVVTLAEWGRVMAECHQRVT